jgi:hypothetical protein
MPGKKTRTQKDYVSISKQVYYRRLFTNVQNITTIYKHIYIQIQTNLQASTLLKTHMYRHKVIKNAKLIIA